MDGAVVANCEREPDPDTIKMFVGQLPKSMDECQLRDMFEEYGPVYSVNVMRDKALGISKGCCFVTFYSRRAALKAQDALDNVKTLNGMKKPIQMKPADSTNRTERKLFVGMLNKKLNEEEVRKLFAVYGSIEECSVLRHPNGQSKGCAYVTFATNHAAILAMTLDGNTIMEGCTSPLTVKFAETQTQKEQKKIQQIQANVWHLVTNIMLGQTVSTPMLPNPPQLFRPVLGANATTPTDLQINSADNEAATASAAAACLLRPMTLQNLVAIAAITQPSLTHVSNALLTNTAALLCLLGKTPSAENSIFAGSETNPLA